MEAGGRKYRIEPLRLDLLLAGVLDDYRSTMKAYGIKLRAELPAITIKSDQEMLFHVFSNMINNAIKYRKDQYQPQIDLLMENGENGITVRVTDNGIGLTETEQLRAFDKFYQATASAEGSGVGLTISRMIVEDLNGKIRLESPGQNLGTMVIVQLPFEVME